MAKRKEENFCSPENAKRPRQEEVEDFDKDGDEDECTDTFTNGTSTLVSTKLCCCFFCWHVSHVWFICHIPDNSISGKAI